MLAVNTISQMLEKYMPDILAFAVKVLIAIVILIVGRIIIKIIVKLLDKILSKSNVELSVVRFLKSLIKALFYVVLIVVIFAQLGIPTASFVAVLGSAGIAIGLALQGSLSNFAGGVLILILKPFKVGDYISDGNTGREGTVYKIDLFYTTIITIDNKKVTIPNGTLANSDITNATAYETRRLDMNIRVSYSSDINQVKDILSSILDSVSEIMKDQERMVIVKEFGASEITMEVRVWLRTEDYWPVKFRIHEMIKIEFDKFGIEIPYNQLDVFIKNKEGF